MIEGAIDLRLGSPCDPPPDLVIDAMASAADSLGPYGKSVGSPVFRQAAADWMRRRLDVEIDPESVAACVGTKEFVAGLALLLGAGCGRGRDTVLIPAVAYPTYAVGAELAGCRVVRVPIYGQAESLNLAMAATICVYASASAHRVGADR